MNKIMPVLEDLLSDIERKRAQILEDFAKAYLASLNPIPDIRDIELVQDMRGTEIVWYFRLRTREK